MIKFVSALFQVIPLSPACFVSHLILFASMEYQYIHENIGIAHMSMRIIVGYSERMSPKKIPGIHII